MGGITHRHKSYASWTTIARQPWKIFEPLPIHVPLLPLLCSVPRYHNLSSRHSSKLTDCSLCPFVFSRRVLASVSTSTKRKNRQIHVNCNNHGLHGFHAVTTRETCSDSQYSDKIIKNISNFDILHSTGPLIHHAHV